MHMFETQGNIVYLYNTYVKIFEKIILVGKHVAQKYSKFTESLLIFKIVYSNIQISCDISGREDIYLLK